MKKWFSAVLALALFCLLAVPAMAEDAEGIYNAVSITQIRTRAGETVTPATVAPYGEFYAGGVRFSVTYNEAVSGREYTVYVVKGSGVPTLNDLYYINQKVAQGTAVTFDNVFPRAMESGDYRVYVTGAGTALDTSAPLATFSYHALPGCNLTVQLQDAATVVTLVRDGAPVTGDAGVFTQILKGHYTLTLSKTGYAAYTKSFDLTENTTLQTPALVKRGNVNGATDGQGQEVSVLDMACLFTWLSTNENEGQIADASYFKQVCDVNTDGAVNILDYQALYEIVKP